MGSRSRANSAGFHTMKLQQEKGSTMLSGGWGAPEGAGTFQAVGPALCRRGGACRVHAAVLTSGRRHPRTRWGCWRGRQLGRTCIAVTWGFGERRRRRRGSRGRGGGCGSRDPTRPTLTSLSGRAAARCGSPHPRRARRPRPAWCSWLGVPRRGDPAVGRVGGRAGLPGSGGARCGARDGACRGWQCRAVKVGWILNCGMDARGRPAGFGPCIWALAPLAGE